jgi:hypothetical protein
VEYVGLSNGLPVETFKEGDPPCRLQSARLRGLELLHLNDDMQRLADSIVYAVNHVRDDVNASLEAQGFTQEPARGQA